MCHVPTRLSAVLILLFLSGINVILGRDKPASKDLGTIKPPGGVPLDLGRPGEEIKADGLNKATKRLESTPQVELSKWVFELERILDKKLDGNLEREGCCTYFVIHVSLAFDGLQWNFGKANKLFLRAQSIPSSESKIWKEAFEAVLKREIDQAYAVPLVLIPVDALHEREKYSVDRAKRYLARLKQLTAEDVTLWCEQVDRFGGTKLDAAVNIILLDDYFEENKFQRDKFKAAIEVRKE